MPKPRKNEKENEFISRCMGDDEMNQKYPDKDQRYAICKSFWKNRNKKKNNLTGDIQNEKT